MKLPSFYIAFCLAVLGGFSYGKYRGLDMGNTVPGQSSTSSGSSSGGYGGGYHNTGSSGGSHK
jgi:hypothetical protein